MEDVQILGQDVSVGVLMLVGLGLLIGAVAKWRMFVKCNQPGLAAFVPVWDLIVTMRIIGRPDSHILFFLIPVFNIYFGFRVLIEIAQSFGKNTVLDYFFVVVFNILYLLNLALAYNEVYYGPIHGRSKEEIQARKAQYATT
ncbi:MAG: DUF5684 domain-containing protein [Flavobacteriales bacterium]|nr:DUF5684 domain-containing protein [Flavobacteriales bacterium]MDG1781551.1 DUF5684 domain-containing protein [Flavobacteriales bacterium]MDG2245332.1 DUF5684 domain-containing protein [Flavobacteriales bacterium]